MFDVPPRYIRMRTNMLKYGIEIYSVLCDSSSSLPIIWRGSMANARRCQYRVYCTVQDGERPHYKDAEDMRVI